MTTDTILTDTLRDILRETFEGTGGQGSQYIDGKGHGSFLETLDRLSAPQASRSAQGTPSIAAHTEHTRYYLYALRQYMLGTPGYQADWPASWQVSAVSETEWAELRQQLRAEYTEAMGLLAQTEDWTDDLSADALALLAHSAYHLGAVRLLAQHFVSAD